jgi:nitrogen-specific signal transduction histidine kinase
MNPFLEVKIAGKYVGYGLGPLAMKIIRMHEGELQQLSEENKGTVTIVFKSQH